jgi:hypothetical protein
VYGLKDSNQAFIARLGPEINYQACLFIHSFISVTVPKKVPSHEMQGEHTIAVTKPYIDGRPTYNMVQLGSPRG